MHKLKHGKLPESFQILNYFRPPTRPTREINLHLAHNTNRSRTKYTSALPFHKYPQNWNQLDPVHQEIPSYSLFKREVRASLLGRYRQHVICDNPRCRPCSANEVVY